MKKNHKLENFSLTAYDQYMCLKPPVLLWIAMLYLSRALLIPLVIALSNMKGGGTSDAGELTRGAFHMGAVLAAIPVGCVLYAFMRRTPTGSDRARWIWRRGQSFLAVAATLDLSFSAVATAVWQGGFGELDALTVLASALDLYFLAYVLLAKPVRDVFADFPEPENVAAGSTTRR